MNFLDNNDSACGNMKFNTFKPLLIKRFHIFFIFIFTSESSYLKDLYHYFTIYYIHSAHI